MTICPTSAIIKDNCTAQASPAIALKAVYKKYQLMKQGSIAGSRTLGLENLWALKDVSVNISHGEIFGIIGRNGAGKTTFLNIIAGALSQTAGEIKASGRVLGLFNLGLGFQDELTGRENIFLNGALIGATRKELEQKIGSIIEFSELGNFIDMPLGAYSQGMRLRLAFSIVVNLDFDTLAIDEVLAVGDTLFQSKCYERLLRFKREGKTMVITTQDLSLIERFCDRVAVLNHGALIFCGDAKGAVVAYRSVLNAESFFVACPEETPALIKETKKWSEDMPDWGKVLGTKEVIINSVKLTNQLGFVCREVKVSSYLKIKVSFNVLNTVKNPHFGIAVFRKDGAYCFGPNTVFDGYDISELNPGKGWFALTFLKLLLAPGEYKLSVAVWDKNETVAFIYHSGYYKLVVKGYQLNRNGFLEMPYEFKPKNFRAQKNLPKITNEFDCDILSKEWNTRIESDQISLKSVKIFNAVNKETDTLFTNMPAKITVDFNCLPKPCNDLYIWIGIYRDDGIYCQGMHRRLGKYKSFSLEFRQFLLLPGDYRISVGVWDNAKHKFVMRHHGVWPMHAVFNRKDHGTIYLKHKWSWRIPV